MSRRKETPAHARGNLQNHTRVDSYPGSPPPLLNFSAPVHFGSSWALALFRLHILHVHSNNQSPVINRPLPVAKDSVCSHFLSKHIHTYTTLEIGIESYINALINSFDEIYIYGKIVNHTLILLTPGILHIIRQLCCYSIVSNKPVCLCNGQSVNHDIDYKTVKQHTHTMFT